jgi:predicted enzyme related to lactoylglutathione lyase
MPVRFAHTNLVARDWRRLAEFYQEAFGCRAIPPQRDLSGSWLDQATGLENARITGVHLRLPGHGDHGPTLEIFHYDHQPDPSPPAPNSPGFAHIAFAVDDVAETAEAVLKNGGSAVGRRVSRDVPGAGRLTFQYVTDPEGNIVEIQHWETIED